MSVQFAAAPTNSHNVDQTLNGHVFNKPEEPDDNTVLNPAKIKLDFYQNCPHDLDGFNWTLIQTPRFSLMPKSKFNGGANGVRAPTFQSQPPNVFVFPLRAINAINNRDRPMLLVIDNEGATATYLEHQGVVLHKSLRSGGRVLVDSGDQFTVFFEGDPRPYVHTVYSELYRDELVELLRLCFHPRFMAFQVHMLCLHESSVQVQSGTWSWKHRHLRLFNGRLMIFESSEALYPVDVMCVRGFQVTTKGSTRIRLKSPARKFTFKFSNAKQRACWERALLAARQRSELEWHSLWTQAAHLRNISSNEDLATAADENSSSSSGSSSRAYQAAISATMATLTGATGTKLFPAGSPPNASPSSGGSIGGSTSNTTAGSSYDIVHAASPHFKPYTRHVEATKAPLGGRLRDDPSLESTLSSTGSVESKLSTHSSASTDSTASRAFEVHSIVRGQDILQHTKHSHWNHIFVYSLENARQLQPRSGALPTGSYLLYVNLAQKRLDYIANETTERSFKLADCRADVDRRNPAQFSLSGPNGVLIVNRLHDATVRAELMAVLNIVTQPDFKRLHLPTVCVHKGACEKRGRTTLWWNYRYMTLINGRLLMYREVDAAAPMHVVSCMNAQLTRESNARVRLQDSSRYIMLRLSSDKERDAWWKAIQLSIQRGQIERRELFNQAAALHPVDLSVSTVHELPSVSSDALSKNNSSENGGGGGGGGGLRWAAASVHDIPGRRQLAAMAEEETPGMSSSSSSEDEQTAPAPMARSQSQPPQRGKSRRVPAVRSKKARRARLKRGKSSKSGRSKGNLSARHHKKASSARLKKSSSRKKAHGPPKHRASLSMNNIPRIPPVKPASARRSSDTVKRSSSLPTEKDAEDWDAHFAEQERHEDALDQAYEQRKKALKLRIQPLMRLRGSTAPDSAVSDASDRSGSVPPPPPYDMLSPSEMTSPILRALGKDKRPGSFSEFDLEHDVKSFMAATAAAESKLGNMSEERRAEMLKELSHLPDTFAKELEDFLPSYRYKGPRQLDTPESPFTPNFDEEQSDAVLAAARRALHQRTTSMEDVAMFDRQALQSKSKKPGHGTSLLLSGFNDDAPANGRSGKGSRGKKVKKKKKKSGAVPGRRPVVVKTASSTETKVNGVAHHGDDNGDALDHKHSDDDKSEDEVVYVPDSDEDDDDDALGITPRATMVTSGGPFSNGTTNGASTTRTTTTTGTPGGPDTDTELEEVRVDCLFLGKGKPTPVGFVDVPGLTTKLELLRAVIDSELDELPAIYVFVKHGVPVGQRQEGKWTVEHACDQPGVVVIKEVTTLNVQT